MIKSNRGQLSIFMGITLILVMGMLAFIINVGLFVKAKINLQNATDAAAFAGAATQARQLTNIAYANWELRNTYKEWMFKYYVLGQLGLIPYNFNTNTIKDHKVSFLLPTPPVSGFTGYDKYNIPSICIHNNSKTNICPIFALPGIPRFPAIGVAGISEIHEAFVNKLVEEKGKDCSRRSRANFLTALTWAYGSGTEAMPDAPLVATNRPGAWPEALELAMRIRNLEMIANRPPVSDLTLKNITQFQGQADEIALNERPMKAFWSAYRNLGGGVYKDNNTDGDGAKDELSYNLSLTELAPQPFQATVADVSGFLIPPNFVYPGTSQTALQKHYVDLQLMPVNLATMFSTFVDTSNTNDSLGGVKSEATCGISKTALPVPGYILGFNKNPQVLTYYAVKAETKFIGLFFPVSTGDSKDGIKLTAYAAAKPFGGRIGPKLFDFKNGNQTVEARQDKNKRSSAYVSGLKVDDANSGFTPGMPIPSSNNFWANNTNPPIIGGVPLNSPVFFGIPNMIYDFKDEDDLGQQSMSTTPLQVVESVMKNVEPPNNLGLYWEPQFNALKASLGVVNPGTSMSGDAVLRAIVRARRPTKYDAINYLVPDFREVSGQNNAAPMVRRLAPVLDVGYTYRLFAPLMGPNLLYKTSNDVESVVIKYMDANDQSVGVYLSALLEVANGIFNMTSQGDTKEAARSIHVNAGTSQPKPAPLIAAPASDPGCKQDMASKFNHFFREENVGCDIVPLKKLMIDFIASHSANEGSLYYTGYYYDEPSNTQLKLAPEQLMTAYFPGSRQGTSPGVQALAEHPLGLPSGDSYSSKRNFYSTKFFQMAKIIDSPPGGGRGKIDYQEQPALKESLVDATSADLVGLQIINFLKYDQATGINNIFYLDF